MRSFCDSPLLFTDELGNSNANGIFAKLCRIRSRQAVGKSMDEPKERLSQWQGAVTAELYFLEAIARF